MINKFTILYLCLYNLRNGLLFVLFGISVRVRVRVRLARVRVRVRVRWLGINETSLKSSRVDFDEVSVRKIKE